MSSPRSLHQLLAGWPIDPEIEVRSPLAQQLLTLVAAEGLEAFVDHQHLAAAQGGDHEQTGRVFEEGRKAGLALGDRVVTTTAVNSPAGSGNSSASTKG